MKKISIIIAVICLSAPYSVMAEEEIKITPVIQEIPAVQQGEYQTQYPLPVSTYQPQGYDDGKLKGKVVMVPAETTFPAISMNPLSTEFSKLGDRATFYLGSDFYYGTSLIAPAGSKVNGTIIRLKRGGMPNKNGQLQIKFTNIETPTGMVIPVSASILTDDGSGILKGGTAKDAAGEYVKDVGIGAAAGALLGTALGAIGEGVGRGAIYGTAVGGGMGLIQSLMQRGQDIDIPQNVQMNIILDQPITTSSNTPF